MTNQTILECIDREIAALEIAKVWMRGEEYNLRKEMLQTIRARHV